MKKLFCVLLLALVSIQIIYAENVTINVDTDSYGRVFEGIGTLSAGASSRLLIDYPEPYRSDILDYLFKPYFGASQHHIKVEIGGYANSTIGTEPSHARTCEEMDSPDFSRGYEYWLMKEAKRRNPKIMTDMLVWGAPGWFQKDYPDHPTAFFSKDNAEYIAAALKGAKTDWGIDVDYTGIWNEGPYSQYPTKDIIDWIINVYRPTLDSYGLKSVQIVAMDMNHDQWQVVDWMNQNKKLYDTIDIVGEHYIGAQSTKAAKEIGKPIWANEDAWLDESYGGGIGMVRICNRNYIDGRITKTISWATINSFLYFTWNTGYPGKMRADTPWSGHYKVMPAIWAIAHICQFAQPGWQYLDSGCGYIDEENKNGTFVTFKSPDGDSYSVVVETQGLSDVVAITLQLDDNFSRSDVHLWESNENKQFEMINILKPEQDKVYFIAKPNSIYSLTNTTGQKKGKAKNPIPEETPFPLPYTEDFQDYNLGKTPKFFSDYVGGFETAKNQNSNIVLRQILPEKPLDWTYGGNVYPHTLVGDADWKSYEFSVDGRINNSNSIALYGRVAAVYRNGVPPKGYGFYLFRDGNWNLRFQAEHDKEFILKEGKVDVDPQSWYKISLRFEGDLIEGFIDGRRIFTSHDKNAVSGAIGLGCDWGMAEFDNVSVIKIDDPADIAALSWKIVPKEKMTVKVPSIYSAEYKGQFIIDGKTSTYWHSASTKLPQIVEFDLGDQYPLSKFEYQASIANINGMVKKYKLYASIEDSNYKLIKEGSFIHDSTTKEEEFLPVKARYVRFEIIETTTTQQGWANIAEMSFYQKCVIGKKFKIVSRSGSDQITRKGQTLELKAKITPEDAENTNVTWKVFDSGMKNTKTAKISPDGVLTAWANGMYKVQAEATDGSGIIDVFTVNVSGQN